MENERTKSSQVRGKRETNSNLSFLEFNGISSGISGLLVKFLELNENFSGISNGFSGLS